MYPPSVVPLQVTVYIQTEDYYGGVLGVIRASDQDPYDTLNYFITDPSGKNQRYFDVDEYKGTFSAKGPLDAGTYSVNVTVSDGKYKTSSEADVTVIDVSDNMIESAVVIQLNGVTPEKFLLAYRRSFHRAIRGSLNVKSRDIIILSLQHSNEARRKRESYKKLYSKQHKEPELDVLFAIRKSSGGFFPREYVRKKIALDQKQIQSALGLTIVNVMKEKCNKMSCTHGECEEQIILKDDQVAITTDTVSFVSLRHNHEAICNCPIGFSGSKCEKVVNKCAYDPCPSFKRCIPNNSKLGYVCECEDGLLGPNCSQNKSDCIGKELSPKCYDPISPLSFKGKSFVQYLLQVPIERHFSFSVWFRTLHPSGSILFTAGRIDYSILEVSFMFISFFNLIYFIEILFKIFILLIN